MPVTTPSPSVPCRTLSPVAPVLTLAPDPHALIAAYALACMYFAPPDIGPWTGVLIGAAWDAVSPVETLLRPTAAAISTICGTPRKARAANAPTAAGISLLWAAFS